MQRRSSARTPVAAPLRGLGLSPSPGRLQRAPVRRHSATVNRFISDRQVIVVFNMSKSDSRESDGSDLGKDESDSLKSMMFSIKVEYYRSIEYSMKWKEEMNPKRYSKRLKNIKAKTSPSSSEDSIQRRIGGKRQPKGRNKGADVAKPSNDDILDFIDRSHEESPKGMVEVTNVGADHSLDDQISVTSSTMSGPSHHYDPSGEKQLTLCPVCNKLQQKAKRMKAPLKDKLLDTNPKSLTCDQWILLKPWRSKKKFDCKKNSMDLAQLSSKLRVGKKGKKKKKLVVDVECSRPHPFLKRNLHHCVKNPILKGKNNNRRKRAREDTQNPRVAKQKHTHNNHQPISNRLTHDTEPVTNGVTHNSSFCSTSSLDSGPCDSDLTFPPVSVPIEASHSFKDFPKQTVPKRGSGFRDLLAQLRGNSSMIIRDPIVRPRFPPSV